MKFFILYFIFLAFLLFAAGCQKVEVSEAVKPQPSPTPVVKNEVTQVSTVVVDVPTLAGKSTVEVDKILGKPEVSQQVKDPLAGEYRVYKIPNHPKGLAVRFYGDKATSFNLILSKTVPTSRQALKEIFGIDVGSAPPKIDKKEPLSEVWQGTFNGVRFSKVYAKRERENGGFIFVLAEAAQ